MPPAPVGLSFFTFQQLWLLAEVYRGRFALGREERSGFLLYSLFFPTATSGPILSVTLVPSSVILHPFPRKRELFPIPSRLQYR